MTRKGIRPAEAKTRFRLLKKRHPEIEMDLLWEEEAYDQSIHYDALLRSSREGTVTLSFCADHALPWPMRGVHRWSETDLVRVNNTTLKVEQAIACLDFIWDEARIINRLLNVCLIQEVLDKDPIDLSDTELQLAMDGFRRAHKLYKPEDTYLWMEQHGMTQEQLEHCVADEAIVAKLRDRITADRVEDYFAEHRADFNTAFIAQVQFSDAESAHRTYEQVQSGEVDFYEAAQCRFLSAGECSGHPPSDIFAVVQRGQVPTELGAAVFAAASGEVMGPIRTEAGYAIVRVLSVTPARLDERTRNAIKKMLFEEWLAERRQTATIEWYWAIRTRPHSRRTRDDAAAVPRSYRHAAHARHGCRPWYANNDQLSLYCHYQCSSRDSTGSSSSGT